MVKKTLQKEQGEGKSGKAKNDGESLEEQNKELKTKIENDKLKLEHEAFQSHFKTADEYQKALAEIYDLQELNKSKEQELAEREGEILPREKALARLQQDTEKRIAYAEVLEPLGEDREKIVALLKEIRDKVTELVNLPEAFREFNKYGIEKEHDKLYVEIKALIQTWLDTVNECRKSMVK